MKPKSLLFYTLAPLLLVSSPSPNPQPGNLEKIISTVQAQQEENTGSKSQKSKKGLGHRLIENARKYLGMEYRWNGRNTKKNPGLDCLGLIFLAYSQATGKPWYNLSIYPSQLVKSEKLGKPVKGLDGVLREKLDYSKLKKGDILYLLAENYLLDDEPLAKINNKKYWPWHTGLYLGGKNHLVINAYPGDKVRIEPLEKIYFDALFLTRIE